jgi:hypothetical protein
MHSAGLRFAAPEAGEIKGEADQQSAVRGAPVGSCGPGSIQAPYGKQGCLELVRDRKVGQCNRLLTV